jgi:hypothetical protein
VRLGQHRVRLADARCRTEVDPKLAASHGLIVFRSLLPTQRRPYGRGAGPKVPRGTGRPSLTEL